MVEKLCIEKEKKEGKPKKKAGAPRPKHEVYAKCYTNELDLDTMIDLLAGFYPGMEEVSQFLWLSLAIQIRLMVGWVGVYCK